MPLPGTAEVGAGPRVSTARSPQPCLGQTPHVLDPLGLTPANALAKTVGKGPGEPPAPEITLHQFQDICGGAESQDPKQPTSNRAMFLPSYSFPFSVSVLLMKGLLSLGLPSPEKAEE